MRLVLQRLSAVTRSGQIRPLSTKRETPLLNEALRHLPSVRLVSEAGTDFGLMSGEDALTKARSEGLDVMQVQARTEPPVLRIVNYQVMQAERRKKAYDRRKSLKEVKKLQRRETVLKQVRLSPSTDTNDVAMKVRQARQFLVDGYRVKVFMLFRRGQGTLHESAKETLVRIAESLSRYGKVQGVAAGSAIQSLFKETRPVSADGSDEGIEEETPKKKPLEVLIYPLPRKDRSSLVIDDESLAL